MSEAPGPEGCPFSGQLPGSESGVGAWRAPSRLPGLSWPAQHGRGGGHDSGNEPLTSRSAWVPYQAARLTHQFLSVAP